MLPRRTMIHSGTPYTAADVDKALPPGWAEPPRRPLWDRPGVWALGGSCWASSSWG
jgi:hypothetical protein